MKTHNISTVISYCSRDYKWLKPCIDSVKPFSNEIIIPISDHFFNGELENSFYIQKSISENPDVKFLQFEYNPTIYDNYKLQRLNDPFAEKKYMVDIDFYTEIWAWNQIARCLGFNNTSNTTEYILFLDVDEIVDTKRFQEWLNEFPYEDFNSIRFDSYFYFLNTKYQSKTWEDWNGITLVKKNKLNDEIFFKHSSERLNFINFIDGNRKVKVVGLDGNPMFHHYSWVRTKQEMLDKVKSWSHNLDRNWNELIENEFNRNFNVNSDTCFVHNYKYIEVKPLIEI